MGVALAFLTVFGRAAGRPDRRALVWFAPVGALVGGIVGAVGWGAGELWPPLVAAGLAVATDATVTGLLHLDGLADSGDGLLAPMPQPRRLAVMAAPELGAFGVATVVVVVLLRTAAFAALLPLVPGWRLAATLGGWWAASRAAMAVALLTLPAARPGGLAAGFGRGSRGALVPVLVVGAGVALVGAAIGGRGRGLVGLLALVVAAGGVLALAQRRLGGITGDVLGAAGVAGETAALLAGSAEW